ncbi:MAG: polysaccharide biosynthesis C-terminal domain-containing protein, partial [Candidatus Eisenbacteria bacterium]|nr:polysaccharide biosynthesis C-terminal domain-containing protein [Candidatus Eisenbacteria bacterium]
LAALLWLFSGPVSSVVFDFDKGQLYLKLILLIAVADTGVATCLAVLRAEERPAVYSVMTVLRLVLTFSLNIVFVVVLKRNVQGILEAELISGTVCYVTALLIVTRGKALSFSWAKTRQVLSFGVPLVPGNVASLVMTLSDRYFLQHFAALQDVGLYSVGYRIAAALRIGLIEPFRIAWPPYMFSVLDRPDAREIYKKVLVYFTFVCVWGGLFLSVFAREALMLLATPAYYPGHKVVPLLVLSYILVGMCSILAAGIQISNRTKYASYSFMAAACVSLGMNFLLVPRLGMMGAAVASVTAYAVLNFLYFAVSQRLYYIAHEFRRIVLAFVAGIAVYAIAVLLTRGMAVAPGIAVKFVLVLLYPGLLHVLKFYTPEEARKMREILGKLPGPWRAR